MYLAMGTLLLFGAVVASSTATLTSLNPWSSTLTVVAYLCQCLFLAATSAFMFINAGIAMERNNRAKGG